MELEMWLLKFIFFVFQNMQNKFLMFLKTLRRKLFSHKKQRAEKLQRFSADIKNLFHKRESCINLRCLRILSGGLKMISAGDSQKRDSFSLLQRIFNFTHELF